LNREEFPVDVNTAEREKLLRVPGLGVKVVDRIVSSRRQRTLRLEDLKRLGAVLRKARHFIAALDYRPAGDRTSENLRHALGAVADPQRSLF
jgi:predicted DNA-binding helix-hairpin-helix protein